MGNRHPTIVPYETFEAADGEFVIAVGNDDQWKRFCGVIGAEDLKADERFATNRGRITHYDTLRPQLAERLRARPRGEWVAALKSAGVPCGSVRSVAEVLTDPHLEARDMIQQLEHAAAGAIKVLGVPIKLSDTQGAVRTPPPALGQHTDEILRSDVGLTTTISLPSTPPEPSEPLRSSEFEVRSFRARRATPLRIERQPSD